MVRSQLQARRMGYATTVRREADCSFDGCPGYSRPTKPSSLRERPVWRSLRKEHGLRPHLTRWQARLRRWYKNELEKKSGELVIDLQEIQRKFPKYEELKTDMERVNHHLMKYRENMRRPRSDRLTLSSFTWGVLLRLRRAGATRLNPDAVDERRVLVC